MANKKDIHILVKQKSGKNRYYVYVVAPAHGCLWVTKDKTLSSVEEHRAFVSSWENLEKIMEMLSRGEIK